MRESKTKWLAVALLAVLAGGLSCTGNDLDDSDAADVILEVVSLENPPVEVRCQLATEGQCSVSGAVCTSNADCQPGVEVCILNQLCQLEITDWDATIGTRAKNSLAISPYNDLILQNVTISYAWIDVGLATPVRTVGLGNVIVPVDSSAQVSFAPIALDDLSPGVEGHTANLTLTFNAITVEGTRLSQTVGRQLHVESQN